MFLENIIKFTKKCEHLKITPDMEGGYCPDCGKYVINEWYITRCSCCGVKLKTIVRRGQIIPQELYCKNCGTRDFVVEKLDRINFVDINFAVLVKRVIENSPIKSTIQCWEERTNVQPKLLVQNL